MSPPKYVFVDTCIFEAKAFNLSAELFEAFAGACKNAEVGLVLPKVIETEIERHIAERGAKAVRDVRSALRNAPFLAGWDVMPKQVASASDYMGRAKALSAIKLYWRKFDVTRIDYSAVDLTQVMAWYEGKWSGPPKADSDFVSSGRHGHAPFRFIADGAEIAERRV